MALPEIALSLKIKICGITSLNDALGAVEAGADALGFMFYEGSPRRISPQMALKIIRALPPFVSKVGVFVNPEDTLVRGVIDVCGIDTIQFHGDETPDFCRRFQPLKIIKAFRIKDASSLSPLGSYDTDAWLLDSFVPGKEGGTGATFNWELACQAKDAGRPIILAGGLSPENVAEAVHEVWPFAVDVSSGVESAPGRKDLPMMRDFVAAVRAIEQQRY